MTNPLPPLKYGKVVGRLLASIIDLPDVGTYPDFPPLEGRVIFKADVPKFLVPNATPPASVVPLTDDYFTCTLDAEGFLTWRGVRGVKLPAPISGTMNPSGWTWRVSFELTYLGTDVPFESFNLTVPEYTAGPDPDDPDTGSTGLVDLALASPVPSSEGNAVTRGVSVNSVGLSGNALIFGLDDGSSLTPVTVPSIAASAASAAAAAASATAAAGSATTALGYVNSFSLTPGTVTTGAAGSSVIVGIHGGPPGYTIDFTIPKGDTGSGAPDATSSVKGLVQLSYPSAGDLGGTAAAPTTPNKVDKFAVTAVKTTTYTASVGDLIPCDASSAGFTVTLPSAPADKARIFIKKIDTSTNAVTIARGGSDVFEKTSGATSLTLTLTNQSVLLIYNSSAGVWYASHDLVLSTLDSRFSALNLVTAVKTTTYTAVAGDFVPCDATSAGFTVTLPSAPADGTLIVVKKTDSSANTVTVSRGGSDVFNSAGGATTMSITKQDQAQRYLYKASSGIWYVTNHISNSDSRLSDTRTPTAGTSPYDLSIVAFGKSTTRATGTGDFPFGVKLQRAATFTSVTYRGNTNGGSGSLVVELRKNGSAVSGTSASITGTTAATGGTATGSWAFSAGDVLTVQITTADGTPGTGLIADITGLA